jgi:thioredoxin reductase (NADPH)
MVRNYLGFADGVSGSELVSRAWEQAWRFGVHSLVGRRATAIRSAAAGQVVSFDDGAEASARSTVIATGLEYRRMGVPSIEALIGRGVFYGSGLSEAQAIAGQPVVVVGGANSAGEAVAHLARYASRVTLLVRGATLDGSMSEYLIEQLDGLPNVDVRVNSEAVAALDERRLRAVVVRDRGQQRDEEIEASALFVLIGAVPRTDWLPATIQRDDRGFVLTGGDAPPSSSRDGHRRPLETTMANVFAVGDVRRGSIKRIAAAVGEGATAVRQIVEGR